MAARKAITKKTRFEVFKRDSFTCQYCGRKAPEVILHVDHIKPVAKGGGASMVNLVTSCVDCNFGKGARELSDDTVVRKQQAQIEQLQERREQLDMLMAWHTGLSDIQTDEVKAFESKLERLTGKILTSADDRKVRLNLKKFGLSELLESLDISFNQYFEEDTESIEKVLTYTYKIAAVRKSQETKPYLMDLFRVRKFIAANLRNIPYPRSVLSDLEVIHVDHGVPIEAMVNAARVSRTYNHFIDNVKEAYQK